MKEWNDAAKDIALDVIADNQVAALEAASAGAPSISAHHIGEAVEAIIELSSIVHDTSGS
jgi:hypothetical protein